MKAIYSNFALGLMTLALFCVVFALTLANPDEIRTLAIVAGVSVGLSLWLLNWGEKK
jgi:lipopolysaccharide export LptBFGC system permease protein LptF